MNVRDLFEAELRGRDLSYGIDPESGRHALDVAGGRLLVSIENLRKEVERDGDTSRIARFVDAIMAAAFKSEQPLSLAQLFWCLERNDYAEPPDYRVPVSDRVDRVLVHLSPDGQLVTWVSPSMLESLAISEAEASERAFENLAGSLSQATVEAHDIDDVQLGHINTTLPFKASLILAPNLKETVEQQLGWPLMAVAPDRDFLYLWAARHADFVGRVGSVVANEYNRAAYPLSTEVYEITDKQIRAIGAFPGDGQPRAK